MTDKQLLGGAVVLVLLGYAFGRYGQPARVKERIVEVAIGRSSTTDTVSASSSEAVGISRTVATETTYHADGAVTVREEETVSAVREIVREVEVVRTVEVERIVYRDRERVTTAAPVIWRAGVEVGLSSSPHRLPLPGIPPGVPVIVGGTLERRLVGPVWGGVWASSVVAVGVRVAIEW